MEVSWTCAVALLMHFLFLMVSCNDGEYSYLQSKGRKKLTKIKVLNDIVRLATEKDDLRNSPPLYDKPTEAARVSVLLYVSSVDAVNEASMDFTVGILLHLRWEDNRIFGQKAKDIFAATKFESLDFDSDNIKKVWVPDVFFPNEKKGSYHEIMAKNQMMRLYNDGTILYISRLSMTLSCPMDLINYPFDKQTCHLLIMSFGYSDVDVTFDWMNATEPLSVDPNPGGKAVIVDKEAILPQFEIKGAVATFCNRQYHQKIGNHSCLQADFILVRNVGFYIVQMYIPSTLIVVLSWISFWLTVNSVPGRISLGLLTVLTMTTQSSSVNASLPRVSYTKAIDIWMSTCLVFVFAALFEFAVVNVLSRKDSLQGFSIKHVFTLPKELEAQQGNQGRGMAEVTVPLDGLGEQEVKKKRFGSQRGIVYATYLDMAARVFFPLTFIIFIFIYWLYYVNNSA